MPPSSVAVVLPACLALAIAGSNALAAAPAATKSNEQTVAELARGCWAIRGETDDGVARGLNLRQAAAGDSTLMGAIRRADGDERERPLEVLFAPGGAQVVLAVLPDEQDDSGATVFWPAKIPVAATNVRGARALDPSKLIFTRRAWRIVFAHGDLPTQISAGPTQAGTHTAFYQEKGGAHVLSVEVSATRLRVQTFQLPHALADASARPRAELLFEGRRETCAEAAPHPRATQSPARARPLDSTPGGAQRPGRTPLR